MEKEAKKIPLKNAESLDIEYWKSRTPEEKFGFKDVDLAKDDFQQPEQIIQLGNAPLRINIVTSIDGVNFKEAWSNRTSGRYGNLNTNFISKSDLIKNKKATGRAQDIADLEKLKII